MPFSDFDVKLRLFMGYWDYMAFDNAKDILVDYMALALNKIKDENLVGLCEKYEFELGGAKLFIKNNLDQMFFLDYYKMEKNVYALATVEDVERLEKEINYENFSVEDWTMMKIYLEQNVIFKKSDEKDLKKLIEIVEEQGESALRLDVVDNIKRERFGLRDNYMEYIKDQLEFYDSFTEIMVNNFGGFADKLFQEFYNEHLSEIYGEMHMAIYERKASVMFKVEGC